MIASLLNKNTTKRGKKWTGNLVSSINLDGDDSDDSDDCSSMEIQDSARSVTPDSISESLLALAL